MEKDNAAMEIFQANTKQIEQYRKDHGRHPFAEADAINPKLWNIEPEIIESKYYVGFDIANGVDKDKSCFILILRGVLFF